MPTLETYLGVRLWAYIPNLPAAVAFAILFGLVTVGHGWKIARTKMWSSLPFVIGGILEVIGYIARGAAYNATGSLVLYLLQAIFLVLPPVFFAASIYMVYSRVVRSIGGGRFSLLSPRRTTLIFVSGDWLCLNIQSSGSGLLSKPKNVPIGDHIIIAGLGLQVLIFLGFLVCCATFHVRFRAHLASTDAMCRLPWQTCLHMLYATSLAILVRNVYRMVEFAMGQDGYLLSNEWPTYVFDGSLMLLVMIAFLVWYPSQFQPDAKDTFFELTVDGTNSVGVYPTADSASGVSEQACEYNHSRS